MSITTHPPAYLQPILWSADVASMDLEKDKGYIIHQILSHGTLAHIRWLFGAYKLSEITEVFQQFPYKDYRASRFHFVKTILLHIDGDSMDERRYVKNIPRAIG